MKKAVFVDKDGTLIPDIPYNVQPDLITLSPGAGETLYQLQNRGYMLVVISNQSGIARGLFPESAMAGVRARLEELLGAYQVRMDGFYYCPHLPDAVAPEYAVECACRKPEPGMIYEAARDLGIDPAQSWMIGDIATDMAAGKRAGCRTVLIEKPYDPQRQFDAASRPDFHVQSWYEAARVLLNVRQDAPLSMTS